MNISTITYQKLNHTWYILRFTYAILFLIAGLDKFARILVSNWPEHISPIVSQAIHMPADVILFIAAVIELTLTFLILTHWPRFGAYLATLWLFAWVANYMSFGSYGAIAVCDFVMAIGAFTLGRLTTIKDRIANEDFNN